MPPSVCRRACIRAEYELDVGVYGSVALACERAKNWRQLMWTFDEMQLRGLVPTLDSYKSAIKGCTQEGEWEMALSLVLGGLSGPAGQRVCLFIWVCCWHHGECSRSAPLVPSAVSHDAQMTHSLTHSFLPTAWPQHLV